MHLCSVRNKHTRKFFHNDDEDDDDDVNDVQLTEHEKLTSEMNCKKWKCTFKINY